MNYIYAIIALIVIFIIWSNSATKKLDKIGEIALKQYFETKDEKYKAMLCILAATYQGENKNRFWRHYTALLNQFPDDKSVEALGKTMRDAGSGLQDSIKQKELLREVDSDLLEIINWSQLSKFEQYVENKMIE